MVATTFVTGNENKWMEVKAILGTELQLKRCDIDGTSESLPIFAFISARSTGIDRRSGKVQVSRGCENIRGSGDN